MDSLPDLLAFRERLSSLTRHIPPQSNWPTTKIDIFLTSGPSRCSLSVPTATNEPRASGEKAAASFYDSDR